MMLAAGVRRGTRCPSKVGSVQLGASQWRWTALVYQPQTSHRLCEVPYKERMGPLTDPLTWSAVRAWLESRDASRGRRDDQGRCEASERDDEVSVLPATGPHSGPRWRRRPSRDKRLGDRHGSHRRHGVVALPCPRPALAATAGDRGTTAGFRRACTAAPCPPCTGMYKPGLLPTATVALPARTLP